MQAMIDTCWYKYSCDIRAIYFSYTDRFHSILSLICDDDEKQVSSTWNIIF